MALVQIEGQVERIIYVNEENRYTVARLHVPGRGAPVTVLGNFPSLNPGEAVRLLGEWSNHPRFGEQFKAVKYETIIPATVRGMEKYLGSGLVKGIGPLMARRIVEKFGLETLDIIENDIERLSGVPGIGPGRIEMIRRAWTDQKEIREVMVFLQTYGVSTTYATRIYEQYGGQSIDIVRENPYRLAQDIFGIGFLTADRIAEKIGIPRDSPQRAEAGILYVLNELSDEGHAYYPYERLVKRCRGVLGVEEEMIDQSMTALASKKKIFIEDLNTQARPGRFKLSASSPDKAVYLARLYVCETGIAARMLDLLRAPKQLRTVDMDKAVQWVQGQLHIFLAERQIEAVKAAIEEKVMVVTGGPGTGKTTIIKSIIRIYERLGKKVMLAAPTGRAAKRLAEATGREAKTIHRLLEFQPRYGSFKKNEAEPLEGDVLIVDEVSMIDTVLMYHLLKAISLSATFVLVGDIHQLPSVGPGNVLKDIISSGVVRVVELSEIFRQARQSLIVVNAHRINRGRMPIIPRTPKEPPADFYFIKEDVPEQALSRILELIKRRIPRHFGLDPVTEVQVLTPMYKGVLGATNLNAELQNELNQNKIYLSRGGKLFKLHDKVMQIRNDYDKGVFNGDIGRISTINGEKQEVAVRFDGREVLYDFSELDELVLAYAVSVHKSQGSEYPAVVIPIMTQHYMLLQRNLLYTAVTRARKLAILIGTPKALAMAVKNNRVQRRYTRLAERLINTT